MKLEDLIALLKRNAGVNFIGMAITPLQMAGIDASIMYLESRGVAVNGYILVTSHPSTGRSINKNNFVTDAPGIKFLDFDYSFKTSKTIKEQLDIKKKILESVHSHGKEDIYFAWTETVSNIMYAIREALPNKHLKLIKIDDGAGSYMPSTYLRFSYLQYEYNLPIAFIKAAIYGYATKKNRKVLSRNNAYIDANIFKVSRENGKVVYIPNKEFVSFYNDSFRRSCENQSNLTIFEDSIVINTQPLKEMGITDGVIDYELYKQLNDVFKHMDRNVVLKPHPREQDIERYNNLGWITYAEKGVSQEGIFASVKRKPLCLISLYSSTLLNAYGLSNIPVISLARILLEKQIPGALRKELKEYIKNYRSIVYFPASFEELHKHLVVLCAESKINN